MLPSLLGDDFQNARRSNSVLSSIIVLSLCVCVCAAHVFLWARGWAARDGSLSHVRPAREEIADIWERPPADVPPPRLGRCDAPMPRARAHVLVAMGCVPLRWRLPLHATRGRSCWNSAESGAEGVGRARHLVGGFP